MATARSEGVDTRRRDQIERITRVATRLFQRNGYETTSVNDIAAALEISVGGLYRYITTKSDLLDLVCEDIYGELPLDLAAIDASDLAPARKLDKLLGAFFEACAHNRELILLMYREYRHLPPRAQARFKEREQAIVDIFARALADGVASSDFRKVDTQLLALDIIAIGHLPALKGWALRGPGRNDEALARSQKTLLKALLDPTQTAG